METYPQEFPQHDAPRRTGIEILRWEGLLQRDCSNKIRPTHIKRYSKVNVCKSKKNDNKDNQALTLIAKTDLLPPIDPW